MARKKKILRENFDQHLDGVYGVSKTSDSYKIDFLSTSMKIEKAVNQLKTALDELEFEKLSFNEIIQRDIDDNRVDKKIIGEYLEKSKERVVFFPPLVVSLVEIQNGVPVQKYPEPKYERTENHKNWGPAVIKKWGNLFRAVYLIEEEPTPWFLEYYQDNGEIEKFYYTNFEVSLDYDSNHIKLIVVDGQHRLKALQKLYRKNPGYIKDMDIPICIFFPSNATVGDGVETVVGDMRDCFVTINTEAQKVSGHFRDLLDDNRISCAIVRGLADNWKSKTDSFGKTKSRLHLLEWNQREDAKASQRTVDYSITTVKILTDIFDAWIFKKGNLEVLLNLRSKQSELDEAGDQIKYDDITNEQFEPAQVPIITELINTYIVPSLDCLLRRPLPYEKLEKKLNEQLKRLDEQAKIKTFADSFQKRLFEFRKANKDDSPESRELEEQFLKDIKIDFEDNKFFLTNVFQTGLIVLWSDLCQKITAQFSIAPYEIAETLVLALNQFCFKSSEKVFHPDRPYTQDLLFTGERINTQNFGKNGCKLLIAISLLKDESAAAFKVSENAEKIFDEMKIFCTSSFHNYKEELWKRKSAIMMRNWKYDPSLPDKILTKLTAETNKDKIKQICKEYVEDDIVKCMSVLENMIDKQLQ